MKEKPLKILPLEGEGQKQCLWIQQLSHYISIEPTENAINIMQAEKDSLQ
jgi:hypothetical protein